MLFRYIGLSALLLCLFDTLAHADEQRTNRVLENPVLDGNLILRVNDGGVKTDALSITGSTSEVTFSNGVKLKTAAPGNSTLSFYRARTSWTPALSGSGSNPSPTYISQTGFYSQLGGQVFVEFSLLWSASTAGTGDLRVNLPVASVNTANYPGTLHCQWQFIDTNNAAAHMSCDIISNSSQCTVVTSGDNTNRFAVDAGTVGTGSFNKFIICSGHYFYE